MEATILDSLQSLRNELSSKHYKGQLDPFSLYVLVFIENFIHLIIRKEREREWVILNFLISQLWNSSKQAKAGRRSDKHIYWGAQEEANSLVRMARTRQFD